MNLSYWWWRMQDGGRFYAAARTRYAVHSPFLTEFITETLLDQRHYFAFDQAEAVRHYWTKRPERVPMLPQGAGSRVSKANWRSARSLARHSAVPPWAGRFLFRLARWLGSQYTLELGTNLGVSTLYLYGADRRAHLLTVEGNPQIAQLAQHSFQIVRADHRIDLRVGPFAEVLPAVLPDLPRLDLLFLDGDHRQAATLAYVQACLPYLHTQSVVVVADIHWSPGMAAAWQQLKALPGVTGSVDVYHFGLLFFREEWSSPLHLTLLPAHYKPWDLGFWS